MEPTLEFLGSPPHKHFLFEKITENASELRFITTLSTVFSYVSCESLQTHCDTMLSSLTNNTYIWVIDCTDAADSATDIWCILYIANWVASKYKHHLTQVLFQHPSKFIHTMLYTYWHELKEDLQQIIVIADYKS